MAEKQKTKKKRPTELKRKIQDDAKKIRRKAFRSKIHTAVRGLKEALKSKDDSTKTKFSLVCSLMDKAVKKKIFEQNKAARSKSRLAKLIKN